MKPWPLSLRLLFRFLFCYALLYVAPAHGTANLLGSLPGTSWITGPYTKLWDGIETWLAVHVFHLSGEITTRFLTGSGDTSLDYIQTLCNVVLALIGMIVWSILGRRQREYSRLHAWLRVLIRYTLAITMLSYGFAKVFPLSSGPPDSPGCWSLTASFHLWARCGGSWAPRRPISSLPARRKC